MKGRKGTASGQLLLSSSQVFVLKEKKKKREESTAAAGERMDEWMNEYQSSDTRVIN